MGRFLARRSFARMRSPDSAPRRLRRRLVAATLGVVGALLVAELVLRVAGLGLPPVVKRRLRREDVATGELVYHCYPSNPNGEFQPVPDVSTGRWELRRLVIPAAELPLSALSETPWCVEYRVEEPPIRGPAPTEFPKPGVVRIAGIGDSFAMGEGVPYEKTLFVHLQKLLGDGCEILNAGVGGFDTDGDSIQLANLAPRRRCSCAVVVYNLNDVRMSPDARARMEATFDLMNVRSTGDADDARSWWRRAFRVGEFVAQSIAVRRIARETVAAYLDAYDPAKNAANLETLAAQFRQFATWPGCRVALVVYPMMYRLEDGYPLQPCHDEVVRLAESAGLPVLDLAPFFAGKDTKSLQVHPIDHHPNGRAHEIAARAIAPWLRDVMSTK